MKAIVQDVYGSHEVLELKDTDTPQAKADEVLIRVHAAGVDPSVWHLMTGQPYMVRVMGYGLRKPKASIPGVDVAGEIEAVGSSVRGLQPGDQVFGVCSGSFAEYACARAEKVVTKPANLTFEQAAAVPVSACTALQGLRDRGRIQPGQRVLIIGAAGGVGTFAVQLARAFGADVTAVCSTTKVDLVRSIGAGHVIDYTREDFADGSSPRYDLILDTAGSRPLGQLRRALSARGTLVIVGGEGGGRWFGVGRQLRALMLSPFVGQRLQSLLAKVRKEDLLFLKDVIEADKVTPVIDRTYPLSEAPAAIAYLQEGHARGKVVVTVQPNPRT
jgi:NADPH:quinone reductase-like Zn-dependent oxidoreductase